MELHFLEFGLVLFVFDDFILHLNLLTEVLLLHSPELLNLDKLLLVTGQGLSHSQLVLILGWIITVLIRDLGVAHAKLLSAWW